MNKSVPLDQMDLLLYAAMAMADSDELLSEHWAMPDESICLSRRADRRIWKKLCCIKQNHEKQQSLHPVKEALKRVAMIVLITATIGFTCLMGIDAIRKAVWKFMIQWYEKSISVEITTDKAIQTLTEIQEYKEPVVSSEFKRTIISKDKIDYIIEYENDMELIVFHQRLLDNYKSLLSNNNTKMHDIEINGHDGIYTVFETHNVTVITILWHDGQYMYSISGNNLRLESLLSVAQSIP